MSRAPRDRGLLVPNWSFHDPARAAAIRQVIEAGGAKAHYVQGDADHNRTVTAFSAPVSELGGILLRLCELILPLTDVSLSKGVHPRAGALDVVPFVSAGAPDSALIHACRACAERVHERFSIPIRFYERACTQARSDLPYLRGQLGPIGQPFDLGEMLHPRFGQAIFGVRDFLIAFNMNFSPPQSEAVQRLCREIRARREGGEAQFAGVRAMRFDLAHAERAQLSFNLTRPERVRLDDLIAWVESRLGAASELELIGVIRESDCRFATRVPIQPEQIVSGI